MPPPPKKNNCTIPVNLVVEEEESHTDVGSQEEHLGLGETCQGHPGSVQQGLWKDSSLLLHRVLERITTRRILP